MNFETKICPVCHGLLGQPAELSGDWWQVHCLRCGDFSVTGTAATILLSEAMTSDAGHARLGPWGSRRRANATGYVRENQGISISTDDIEPLVGLRAPNFLERADKLLLALERFTTYAGEELAGTPSSFLGYAWCLNEAELFEVVGFLASQGRVRESDEISGLLRVTVAPAGWAHLERLRERNPSSSQAFVAMSFDPSLAELWRQGLWPGVRAAGYNPFRIDKKEYAGKIDDEIIAEIRRSKFLVADLTGQRQSVYFEAGFALGLGLAVVWTCRQDEVENLHFDIRQYNCIVWGTPQDLVEPLANRVRALFGQGPKSADA
jgi:hypothetical protein